MDKLKNIKVVFVDIDGTLSNSHKKISEETKNAIKSASKKGIKVILCSGRGSRYVHNFSKIANASSYIISCNGAQVFDYSKDAYIYESKMDFENIKKIWDYCNDNDICCILNGQSFRYSNNFSFIKEEDKILIENIYEIKDVDIYQIVVGSKTFDPIYKMDLFINKNTPFKIVNASSCYINKDKTSNHYFLDVTNSCVSKGNAIKKILSHLNLTKDNSIGFGDHINDYELFDAVGFKVAMNNAMQKLKDKADFITLSNNDNGVAYFLNNFIDYDDMDYNKII